MRTLALDFGDVRIGVAISDAMGWTASPLCAISRKNPIDLKSSIEELCKIVKEREVSKIVVGMPKNMNNTQGENCEKVQRFAQKLEKAMPDVEIVFFDERLSTQRALRIYQEAGISAKKREKGDLDKMAAQIILQGYLDLQR
ncbi:MAG: Holliday junction resolvase RuvX [Defluviitaleaceae bacterium]|nr:Holliday junction resolvase RuvX [Defluviitaleaceae bacterium]